MAHSKDNSDLKLGFLRHSFTPKRDVKDFPDDDIRPLSKKGRKCIPQVAKGFLNLGFQPDRIFTSPILRARQTAEAVAETLEIPSHRVKELPSLRYDIDVNVALRQLASLSWRGQILMVGHEPWLGEMISLLICGRTGPGLSLRKCGFALLRCETFATGQGRLEAFLNSDAMQRLSPEE